ncbi:hypothetical protein AFB00_30655 (plasmid) [Pseudonocardia sp. HH130630-07]|nr:hypothetical protein AFB00_30655 [Pseudonocardia sp. HH130630-07]
MAASAASLMALSPIAFAADSDHDGDHGDRDRGHHRHHDTEGIDKGAEGLIAGLNGNNVDVPVQACNNNVPVNVLGVQVPVEDAAAANGVTGALGILGDGAARSGDSVTDQSDTCAQSGGSGDSVD